MCFIEAVDPPQLTAEVIPLRLAHSGKDQHPVLGIKVTAAPASTRGANTSASLTHSEGSSSSHQNPAPFRIEFHRGRRLEPGAWSLENRRLDGTDDIQLTSMSRPALRAKVMSWNPWRRAKPPGWRASTFHWAGGAPARAWKISSTSLTAKTSLDHLTCRKEQRLTPVVTDGLNNNLLRLSAVTPRPQGRRSARWVKCVA